MKKLVPLVVLFCSACVSVPGIFAAPPDVTIAVNSGHTDTVYSLAHQTAGRFLFSGGSDGTVRIWDAEERMIVDTVHVTPFEIRKIAVNPVRPQFAVLETDGSAVFRVSAWDWEQKKQLFVFELDEFPLYLGYSPKGSFLVYSETDWNSLTFLESISGRRLPYLRQGFGIVSFLTISDSESTIITYNPVGTITYWDLKSGEQRYQFRTLPNLRAMSVNSTKRYMAATDGRRLVYVDLTRDNRYAEAELANISLTAVHPDTGRILCYSTDPITGEPEISLWEYSGGFLIRQSLDVAVSTGAVKDFAFAGSAIYTASQNGSIWKIYPATGWGLEFPSDRLSEITGLAFSGSSMHLSTADSILTFDSDFFSGSGSGRTPEAEYFTSSVQPNPLGRAAAIEITSEDTALLWSVDDQPGSIVSFTLSSGELGQETVGRFTYPIATLVMDRDRILVLEKNGRCRILDGSTLTTRFEYSSLAVQSIASVSDRSLLLGRSSVGQIGVPLLHIDTVTGETVPVYDSNLMVFRLAADTGNERVFSLGLENRGGTQYTVLKVHRGAAFERSTTILSYRGEDLSSNMVYDSGTGSLYTTLGMDGVRKWNGSSLTMFEKTNHIPRRLFLGNGFLYAINRDKTVSMWDMKNGRHVLDFYLFEDQHWAAVFPDGTFFSSDGAVRHLLAYEDFSPIPGGVSARRLTLDRQPSGEPAPERPTGSAGVPGAGSAIPLDRRANRETDYYGFY